MINQYFNVYSLRRVRCAGYATGGYMAIWINAYVTHVLDCMARAADEMDVDISIFRNEILVGEMCYFMVNS